VGGIFGGGGGGGGPAILITHDSVVPLRRMLQANR